MGNNVSLQRKPVSPIAEPTDEIIVTDEEPTNLCVNFGVIDDEEYELLAYVTRHPAYSWHEKYDVVWSGDQGRQNPVIDRSDLEEHKANHPDSKMVKIGDEYYRYDEVIVTYQRPCEMVVGFKILEHERDELLAWVTKHPAYNFYQTTYRDFEEPDRRVKILTHEEYGRKLMGSKTKLLARLPGSE
ncbi:hypothetical protein PSEUBRA_003133 [Kalmanozyma brasiliensis GHG001]|uniref:uncharacterized protein n=1 Tax=Kalmanozyma brasiliensis (strain GHG001) TaxID=1365824 RepID=UPI001CE79688|nr:uncharacterized protein PSEUBRA_003133 [Kalmanozyma brasiliensis GHG001]KAF6767191.1 hypothetical protein PSEUBRA_003133 [Kalmanozyma brasiliensis GHG001]